MAFPSAKISLLFASLIGLAGSSALAQWVPPVMPASDAYLNPWYRTDIFASEDLHHATTFEAEFRFQDLTNVIDKQKLVSVEGLVAALPDAMKNDNYVLMYHSRSLQEASPEAPRVIAFTPMASLVLSFNGGGAGVAGGNTVEIIQLDRAAQRFEFREIVFDGKFAPRVSPANPAKCLSCHQANSREGIDLRPNWEPYSVWPGAYGSDDGRMDRHLKAILGEKMRAQDAEALEQQLHEQAWIAKFQREIAPYHPRYSLLGNFNPSAPVELSDHLGIWNFLRVARLMREQAGVYPAYRPLLELTARCNTDDYLRENPYISWAAQQPTRQYFHYAPARFVSKMLTDIFEPLGVDTSDWSMDFGTRGRLAFFERFGTPFQTPTALQYALHEVDPVPSLEAMSCDELRGEVDAKLNPFFLRGEHLRLQASHPLAAPSPGKQLARCASCHVDGDAPAIAFESIAALAGQLRQRGYPRGSLLEEIRFRTSEMATQREQMPRGFRLSAEDRAALLDYLGALSNTL